MIENLSPTGILEDMLDNLVTELLGIFIKEDIHRKFGDLLPIRIRTLLQLIRIVNDKKLIAFGDDIYDVIIQFSS